MPQFLELNDFIVASPGIDLEPYKDYQDKWLTELDLFSAVNTTPVIAITGSVGKTSVVTLLTGLLNAFGKRACAIGNIGTPMLDLLAEHQNNTYDFFVMELSSFQLEHAQHFKPKIAIITNLIANHLDRHKTLENYLCAKSHILKNQTEDDFAIIPMEFTDAFWPFIGQQKVIWVGEGNFDDITKMLSDISCLQNWNLILTVLELLDLPVDKVPDYAHTISMPRHRVEFLGTHQGVKFYNDSKATVIESTKEALKRFKTEPVLLFLGGLSKGTDRKPLITWLPQNIKHVFCFGKEADQLAKWCTEAGIKNSLHKTLESAFESCVKV
ncbi:UDP-N-acetylmuramoyl-L-alanine--D-glutamate ligase, partial [bacterium]|nr:UDP-N-acetylmuramoyl-L-alanine--D-glutamate ligase [bacterium]